MLLAVLAGVFAFVKLGRNEDPAFTIRTMVVGAAGRAPPSTKRCSR